jgi:hypothetical protein
MPDREPGAAAPPPLEQALGWVGFRVDDAGGTRVGSVQSVYVDAGDGEPVWLLVRVGRFGKLTALPYAECADGAGRVWVAHERKTIRSAPAVGSGQPLTREDEVALCAHYLIGSERGRHAAIAKRPAKAVTSKPAEVSV